MIGNTMASCNVESTDISSVWVFPMISNPNDLTHGLQVIQKNHDDLSLIWG